MDDAKMKRAQRDAEEEMENQREAELEQQVVGGGVKEKEKEVEVTIGAVISDNCQGSADTRNESWKVEKELGKGAFGTVFLVTSCKTGQPWAMKVERKGVNATMKQEREVLQALQGRPSAVSFGGAGVWTDYQYIVMSFLGPDLKKVQEALKKNRSGFTESDHVKIALRSLFSLRELHETGYVHRDVKPENMCFGASPESPNVYLIDYGLARKFTTESGGRTWIRRARERAPFRGTLRYASVGQIKGNDCGRGDDVESWLYSMLELKVDLPWSKLERPEPVAEYKEKRFSEWMEKNRNTFGVYFIIWKLLPRTPPYSMRPLYASIANVLLERMNFKGWSVQEPYECLKMMTGDGGTKAKKSVAVETNNEKRAQKILTARMTREEVGDGEKMLLPPLADFTALKGALPDHLQPKNVNLAGPSTGGQSNTSRLRK